MFTFVFLTISLIVPGGSLLITHKKKWAFSIPFIGLLWVLLLCWPRLVITSTGFTIMLSGLLSLHIFSYLAGVTSNVKIITTQTKQWCYLTLLLLVNLSIIVSCHFYKDKWLGFSFYHIPSVSMSPTLQAGDVVLVDTWAYQQHPATLKDILILKRSQKSMVLAKRLTKIQNKKGNIELFIEGDNTNQSIDSRRFGWVSNKHIIGRVQFVWFSFKQPARILLNLT